MTWTIAPAPARTGQYTGKLRQHHIRREYMRCAQFGQARLHYWVADTYCGRTLDLARDDDGAPMCATCARIWAREKRHDVG